MDEWKQARVRIEQRHDELIRSAKLRSQPAAGQERMDASLSNQVRRSVGAALVMWGKKLQQASYDTECIEESAEKLGAFQG